MDCNTQDNGATDDVVPVDDDVMEAREIEMKRTVDQRLSLQHPPFSTWQGEFVKFSTAIQYYLTNYMIHILYVYGAVFLSI